MANFSEKKSNYISLVIQVGEKMLEVYALLQAIDESERDQGFLDRNSDLALNDEDFVGNNDHLDLALFTGALEMGIRPVRALLEVDNAQVRKVLRRLPRK